MKSLIELLKQGWKYITPPYKFSWETLLALSVYSCVMAFLASGIVEFLIGSAGFGFLVLAIAWLTREHPKAFQVLGVNGGPWLISALISFWAFGNWINRYPVLFFASWPLSAAVIAIGSEFINQDLQIRTFAPAERPALVSRWSLLTLSHLLISCWVGFGFLAHTWLMQYPTLATADFSKSGFVIKLDWRTNPIPRGQTLMEQTTLTIQSWLHNQPWSEIEQRLLQFQQQPLWVGQTILSNLPPLPENNLWTIRTAITGTEQGYNLQLTASWQGPDPNPLGYALFSNCLINPVFPESSPPVKPVPGSSLGTVGQVACGAISEPMPLSQKPLAPPSI